MLRITFFLFLFLFLLPLKASEEIKKEKIEKAIIHIAEDGIPKFRIGFNKKNVVLRNPKERRKLSEAIYEANRKYPKVPVESLIIISFREGSFKNDVIGGIGEKSAFQIAPKMEKRIRKKLEQECSTDTYQGAALCSAALLNKCLEKCGNLEGAYIFYATGKYCNGRTKQQKWIGKNRAKLTKYLSEFLKN